MMPVRTAAREVADHVSRSAGVFELGFAESEGKLISALAEFLAMRPRLGYTKTEVTAGDCQVTIMPATELAVAATTNGAAAS
jgi:hypothetical protein